MGDQWLWPVGQWAQAGWKDYPPNVPWEFDEVDPASYDSTLRLQRMDDYGITVQLLYPNLIGFQAPVFVAQGHDVATECTRAYNDFLVEWCAADPTRLIPIAMLPYWDREASVKELERCVDELGYKGVLFANKFEKVGLPGFCDPYWDPIYQAAQDRDVPVNYHIGFSAPDLADRFTDEAIIAKRANRNYAMERTLFGATAVMTQCDVIGTLVLSGVCDRFPRLKFVSVESAFGHVPFYLENLDWSLSTGGVPSMGLKPSEYFARQCYGTLWFETSTLALLNEYPNNFMFSTDYPHPTSLSPGPASPAAVPSEHVASAAYAALPEDVRTKVLSGNAFEVYKIGPASN